MDRGERVGQGQAVRTALLLLLAACPAPDDLGPGEPPLRLPCTLAGVCDGCTEADLRAEGEAEAEALRVCRWLGSTCEMPDGALRHVVAWTTASEDKRAWFDAVTGELVGGLHDAPPLFQCCRDAAEGVCGGDPPFGACTPVGPITWLGCEGRPQCDVVTATWAWTDPLPAPTPGASPRCRGSLPTGDFALPDLEPVLGRVVGHARVREGRLLVTTDGEIVEIRLPVDLSRPPLRRFDILGGPWLQIVDLDGDGVDDLMWREAGQDGQGLVRWMPGPLTLPAGAAVLTMGTSLSPIVDAVPVADLDGDGVPELAVQRGGTQGTRVALLSGAAVQANPPEADLPALAAVVPSEGAVTSLVVHDVGDLDGDGLGDLGIQEIVPAASSVAGSRLSLVRGPLTGEVSAARAVQRLEGAVRARPLGDLDGDGFPELALTSTRDGTLATRIVFGAAGARVDEARVLDINPVLVDDLDGDGFLDVVSARLGRQERTCWIPDPPLPLPDLERAAWLLEVRRGPVTPDTAPVGVVRLAADGPGAAWPLGGTASLGGGGLVVGLGSAGAVRVCGG